VERTGVVRWYARLRGDNRGQRGGLRSKGLCCHAATRLKRAPKMLCCRLLGSHGVCLWVVKVRECINMYMHAHVYVWLLLGISGGGAPQKGMIECMRLRRSAAAAGSFFGDACEEVGVLAAVCAKGQL